MQKVLQGETWLHILWCFRKISWVNNHCMFAFVKRRKWIWVKGGREVGELLLILLSAHKFTAGPKEQRTSDNVNIKTLLFLHITRVWVCLEKAKLVIHDGRVTTQSQTTQTNTVNKCPQMLLCYLVSEIKAFWSTRKESGFTNPTRKPGQSDGKAPHRSPNSTPNYVGSFSKLT